MSKCKECKPDIIVKGCSPLDASCVIYNSDGSPSNLSCIEDIESGTSLKKILELWDLSFCGIKDVNILPCVKDKLNILTSVETLTQRALLTKIQDWICSYQDINVKVSPSDTGTGYLNDKISTGDCLDKTVVVDEDGFQRVHISINIPCLSAKLPVCFEIKSNECIISDGGSGPCIPAPTTPLITRNNLTLSGSNCNGSLQWFNRNNQLIGTGTVFNGVSGEKYYAKCSTTCGDSESSNSIEVPLLVTYTKTRTAVFTKECGTNDCNIPCIGSDIPYSKTYTSTISQEVANSLAENDTTFSTTGQSLANSTGTCECSDCTCITPIHNAPIITNALCNGGIVSANGQISITGISQSNRVGFYTGSGDYAGAGYVNAIPLVNGSQGSVITTPTSVIFKNLSTETRVIFRLFNGSAGCFKDVIVSLTPPNCTEEQVTLTDVSVSCEIPPAQRVCKRYEFTGNSANSSLYCLPCGNLPTGYDYVKLNQGEKVTRCLQEDALVVDCTITYLGDC